MRELLCHPRMRTARAMPLCLSGRGTHGLLQLHRRLLQSHPAALRPGVSLTPLLRTGDANRPTVRHPLNRLPNRGNFTMALEAAQMRTWHLDFAEHQEGSASGDPCPRPVSLPERWSAAVDA